MENKSRKFLKGLLIPIRSNWSQEKPTLPPERDVPDDILLEIHGYLSPKDLLHASLMSRRICLLLIPLLYASLDLISSEVCWRMLKMLTRRPDISRHVKRLVLRPNHSPGWATASDKTLNDSDISVSVERIASKDDLASLQYFMWDGLGAPTNDSLWLALRKHCSNLIYVGTTVGPHSRELSPHSHLFEFRNLRGFTLVTQKLSRWPDWVSQKDLPNALWDMLLHHCPDLEELTLDSTYRLSELWNTKRLLEGRWPRLRRLSIGVISTRNGECDESDFNSFLEAHSSLSEIKCMGELALSKASVVTLATLPIKSFSGKLQNLTDAPPFSCLTRVILTDWFIPSAQFHPILSNLPTVREIGLCVSFVDSYGPSALRDFLDRLLAECPQLINLDLSVTDSTSSLDDLRPLRRAIHLESFTITRQRKLTENTNQIVLLIACENLSLRQFTVRDVLAWNRQDELNGWFRTKHVRSYQVSEGQPRTLHCHEAGVGPLGAHFSKSWTKSIIPTRTPRHIDK
ncbi:hypothetical protein C8J56DRAFT_980840 [Mycena floridula]|nr:hypothetical protein C8J56DRAFT_980840 [Mycena floridula]